MRRHTFNDDAMNSGKQPWDILAAYFSGDVSDAQRREVDAWRQATPENARLFAQTHAVWRNSGLKLQAGDVDDTALWNRLKHRMDNEPAAKVVAWHKAAWLRVAAGILLLCTLSYGIYRMSGNSVEKHDLASTESSTDALAIDDAPAETAAVTPVVYTAGNRVATVYLPDSTRVWLNRASTLSYLPGFGEQERRVVLTGEGYFDVTRDAAHPFIVSIGHALATVKGTSFNLRGDTSAVVLTVSEGTVHFASADSSRTAVLVRANERASVNANGVVTKSRQINPAFAAWRYEQNPVFDTEKRNPGTYLATKYTWHKNTINQSVIAGVLNNTASLANYSHVVLKVTYTRPNGSTGTASISVSGTVRAGESIRFQKRLLDILTNTRSVTIRVASAVVEQ